MIQAGSSRGGFRGTVQGGFRGRSPGAFRGPSRGGISRTPNNHLRPRLPPGVDLCQDNVGDTSNEPSDSNTYYVDVHDLRSGLVNCFPLKRNGAWLSPGEVPYIDLVSGRYLATPSQETAHGYPLHYDVHDLMPETVRTTRPV